MEDMINASNTGNATGMMTDSVEILALKVLAYSLIILMSLIGNILVIAVIYRERRMKTNMNRFIVNMCLSDILMTFWVLPQKIASIASDEVWLIGGDLGDFLCKMVPLCQDVSAGVSIFSMTVIAFDRFFAIVLPFKAHIITTRRCYLMIFMIWLMSIAIHTPYLFTLKVLKQFPDDSLACRQIWPAGSNGAAFYLVAFSLLYAIPLLAIAFFYTAVILELNRKKKIENQDLAQRRTRQRENREVSLMLITVVMLFAVSWAPLNTLAFLHFFKWKYEGTNPSYGRTLRFVADFMIHSNSAQNAIIYFTFNSRFKKGLKRMLGLSGSAHQQNDNFTSNASSTKVKRWYVKRENEANEEKLELTSKRTNVLV